MKTTIKHRILGFFVMVALLILLFPFFQGKRERSGSELAVETNVINVPPFPSYKPVAT